MRIAIMSGIAVSATLLFAVPAFAQSDDNTSGLPLLGWILHQESKIFDTPSTGKKGDGEPGSGDFDTSAGTADESAAVQSDDDTDTKTGQADLTGNAADDAPLPDKQDANAPDAYAPDAGDPDN